MPSGSTSTAIATATWSRASGSFPMYPAGRPITRSRATTRTGITTGGISVFIDTVAFTLQYDNAPSIPANISATVSEPALLTQAFINTLLCVDLDSATKASLVTQNLLLGQSNPTYWTTAWTAYINALAAYNAATTPTTAQTTALSSAKSTVKSRLNNLITGIIQLPEFQLM